MDADFLTIQMIWFVYTGLSEDGADLAVGSRYVSGVNVVNWPMGASSDVLLCLNMSVWLQA